MLLVAFKKWKSVHFYPNSSNFYFLKNWRHKMKKRDSWFKGNFITYIIIFISRNSTKECFFILSLSASAALKDFANGMHGMSIISRKLKICSMTTNTVHCKNSYCSLFFKEGVKGCLFGTFLVQINCKLLLSPWRYIKSIRKKKMVKNHVPNSDNHSKSSTSQIKWSRWPSG